jgi:serine protease
MSRTRYGIERLAATLLVAMLSLTATARPPTTEWNPVARQPLRVEPSSGRIIVGFKPGVLAGAGEAAATSAVGALSRRARVPLSRAAGLTERVQVTRLEAPATASNLAAALEDLRADPNVAFAELDQRRYAHAVPNDPLFTGQWYMQTAQPAAVAATTAWDGETGSAGVVVAVLDTGARFDHPDLQRAAAGGRLLPGYDFVSGDRDGSFTTANDGDGRDPDASDPGDWVTDTEAKLPFYSDCTASSSSWHGTRVAGIIGARSNNSTGIAGLTWASWILPVRVLGKCGGYDSDILAAIRWAGGLSVGGVPANPYPARIINLSLGSTGACPASYQTVIDELAARGVLVVASAGNESGPVGAPADCKGVVSVVALRHVGTKVGFSNLGAEATIGAPGGNCVNTGAGQPCLFSIDTTTNSGTNTPTTDSYTDQQNYNVGTSFSAPIVSGVAALMLSVNQNLSTSQLIARLRRGATPYPPAPSGLALCRVPTSATDLQSSECACTTAACGAGMTNAVGALREARRPIAAIAVQGAVSAGQNLVLQGAGSAASCGRRIVSYAWAVTSGSAASLVSGANAASATVLAPATGSVRLQLTVTDDVGAIDSAEVTVGSSSASSTAPASITAAACPTAIVFAPKISLSATTLDFASLMIGASSSAQVVTIANTGNAGMQVSNVGITGADAAQFTQSSNCSSVTVGGSCTINVTFAPTSAGAKSATLAIAHNASGSPSSVALSGTANAPVSSGGGGGGGGAFDPATLLLLAAAALLRGRRARKENTW